MSGVCVLVLAVPLAAAPVASSQTGLAVPTGTRHAGDIVSLGRAVDVAGELDGALISTSGRVGVSGHVAGDVLLLGADATISGPAVIDGDLLSVGGELRFAEGASAASVRGRVITVAAMEGAFLAELKTSPLQASAVSPLLLSFRLLILTAWLVAGLFLLFVRPRRVAAAARFASASDGGGGRVLFLAALGLTAVLTGLLVSALLLAFVPVTLAFSVIAVVLGALAVAKLFGLVALFLLLGRWLARNARRGSAFHGDPAALALGLLALGLVSLLPAAGAIVWAAASLAGIGLSLTTGFGRETAPV